MPFIEFAINIGISAILSNQSTYILNEELNPLLSDSLSNFDIYNKYIDYHTFTCKIYRYILVVRYGFPYV